MNQKAVETILRAAEGMSRAEWDLICRYMAEEFDEAARRVVLREEDIKTIARRMTHEQGMGLAPEPPANKQTRMF